MIRSFFLFVLCIVGTIQVHGMSAQVKEENDQREELCNFARDLVELLGDTNNVSSGLEKLKVKASPNMQKIIGDLINVLEEKGMSDLVSDFGRRMKCNAENARLCHKDLLPITEHLDKQFSHETRQYDYHKEMIESLADKHYARALYFYLKIAETRISS